jgi:hypothetical protein
MENREMIDRLNLLTGYGLSLDEIADDERERRP